MTVPHFLRVGDIEIWYRVKPNESEEQFRVYVCARYEAPDRSVINLKETEFNWNYDDMYDAFLEIIYVRHGTRDGLAHDAGRWLLTETFNTMKKLDEEEIIQAEHQRLHASIKEMLDHEKKEIDALIWRSQQVLDEVELEKLYREILQRGAE